MLGKNPNKDFKENIQFTGGSVNGYQPSSNSNLSAYKTRDGRRGVVHQGEIYYDNGDGKFMKSSGRDYLTYDTPKKEEDKPSDSGGNSGSSGSGSSGSSGSYPTNPSPGNTGYASVDANSLAMMKMIEALTDSIKSLGEMEDDLDSVSKGSGGSGEGLASTVLTGNVYVPQSEKRKKSYLTPMAVG